MLGGVSLGGDVLRRCQEDGMSRSEEVGSELSCQEAGETSHVLAVEGVADGLPWELMRFAAVRKW